MTAGAHTEDGRDEILGSGTPYISSWFVLCLVLPLWVIFI